MFIQFTRFNSHQKILVDLNKVVTISQNGGNANDGTVFDFGKSEYVVVNESIEEVIKELRKVKSR